MSWYRKAKIIVTEDEWEAIKSIVGKIMDGERDWNDMELQVYQNFPELIERLLNDQV